MTTTFIARYEAAAAAYTAARAARTAAFDVAFEAAYDIIRAECKAAGRGASRAVAGSMTVAERKRAAHDVVTAFVIGDYGEEFAARFAGVREAVAAYVSAREAEDAAEAAYRAAGRS